jgi:hypothetical protein
VAVGTSLLLTTPAVAQESPAPPPEPSPSPSPAPPTEPLPAQQPTAERSAPQLSKPRPKPRSERRRRERKERRRTDRKAQRDKRQCAPFSHTQTYLTWGPALAYDQPVTVVYSAQRCTKRQGSLVNVTTQGSATVYQGILAQGQPIDRRPFRLTGSWDHPSNASGWPLSWWGCGVKHARYLWEIPGVYSFDVGARWGLWSLTVSTQPVQPPAEPRTVHWSYNAC